MKKEYIILFLTILLLIILIPVGMDYLIIGNGFYSNISNSDWVQFLGSYVGSLIGAFSGIVGIIMTIKFSEKQSKEDREHMLKINRDERRLYSGSVVKTKI